MRLLASIIDQPDGEVRQADGSGKWRQAVSWWKQQVDRNWPSDVHPRTMPAYEERNPPGSLPIR